MPDLSHETPGWMPPSSTAPWSAGVGRPPPMPPIPAQPPMPKPAASGGAHGGGISSYFSFSSSASFWYSASQRS